jgi:hypothetical protein
LGSARELETQLIISKEIQIIDNTEWIELVITKVNEVVALLVSTINKLGDVQRNQLTITDIEVKIDGLKANKNTWENQLIVEKDKLRNEIALREAAPSVSALLNIQESRERIRLINQKIAKVKLQSQVFLIKYSNGEGTTNQYLNYQENIDRLDFDLLKATNDYKQNVSKLMLLVE